MDAVSQLLACGLMAQAGWINPKETVTVISAVLHSSSEPAELSQWFCRRRQHHKDFVQINISLVPKLSLDYGPHFTLILSRSFYTRCGLFSHTFVLIYGSV